MVENIQMESLIKYASFFMSHIHSSCSSLTGLGKNISERTLSTILSVEVLRHEYSSTTRLAGTFTTKTRDFAVLVDFVVFEHCQLDFLVLVSNFLRCRVVLLLPLLATTTKPEYKMKCRLLLDVVVAQSPSILQLFACKDETLLIRRDSFLILDLRFHVVDRVRRLNLEGDGLTREGLYKDLHDEIYL